MGMQSRSLAVLMCRFESEPEQLATLDWEWGEPVPRLTILLPRVRRDCHQRGQPG